MRRLFIGLVGVAGMLLFSGCATTMEYPTGYRILSDGQKYYYYRGNIGPRQPGSSKYYTYTLPKGTTVTKKRGVNYYTVDGKTYRDTAAGYNRTSSSSTNYVSNTAGVRQLGSSNYYRVNGKTVDIKQLGSSNSNYYRSGGDTYNVRQLGSSDSKLYKVRKVESKTPTWNWID